MQRITDFTKGLAGLALTLGLLVGLPIGLATIVGWPLPTAWPGLDTIGRHLSDGDVPDTFILKLIALIVWAAWAQITVATLIEYVTILRGKAAHRSPTLPAVRLFAAKLATWTTLLVSAIGPIRPAMAAPLAPISAATVEVDLRAPVSTKTPAPPSETISVATASERYTTQQGDTWWSIAEDLLDDGLRWRELRTMNLDTRMADGTVISDTTDVVRPGWQLTVPADTGFGEPNPTPASPVDTNESEVTVEKGDHFWAIADEALTQAWGRAPSDAELTPYWADLVAANHDRLLPPEDPNLIYPEQRFVIPTPPTNPDTAPDLNGTEVIEPTPQEPPAPPVEDPAEQPAAPTEGTAPSAAVEPSATPATTSPPAIPQPATPAVDDPSNNKSIIESTIDAAKPIAAVAGGIALLGGTLLFTLRGLRRIQAARRRPGTTIDPPEPEAAAFERRIRSISVDGEDVRYLAAVNRYLSHKLEGSDTAIPTILAARAGQYGLELLLDEACEPVAGFVASTPDKTAWQLDPDVDARMMEAAVGDDAHPFSPALCTVGATDAGQLLVDFEQLGSTSIEGPADEVTAFQRGLTAALCASPWGTECEIVAIGVDGLANDELSRVLAPEDPTAWAAETAERMTRTASSLSRSPYEERVAHGEVYHPTIVIIGPSADLAGIAQHLAPVADLAYSPLAVISAHPLASEHRIAIASGIGTIEPLGISFEPVTLAAAELHAVDHLIANASDTSTSPPAEAWADEIRATEHTDHPNRNGSNGAATTSTDPDTGVAAVNDAPIEVSEAAQARISEIMEPRPVEVGILGRKPTVEGLADTGSQKLEAIIVYLTFHRSVSSERFRDEFWPRSNSRAAGDNAITKVRTLLGSDADGNSRLDSARNSGTYTVSDEVGMDWHRVETLVSAAKGASPADEVAYLKAACELIGGHIAADAAPSAYAWLLREPTIYTLIETTLVDAAHRCGELALAAGDCELARWAARKGLTIVEGQESLYRMRMQAAFEAGDRDGIVQAFQEAQRAAESYGYAEEVQPETQALFDQLTTPGRAAAGQLEP